MKNIDSEPSPPASHHLLCSKLDALSAHIAILDEAGRILTVNKAWNAFFAGNVPLDAPFSPVKANLLSCPTQRHVERLGSETFSVPRWACKSVFFA
jgi:hypothetical protein